MDDLVETGFRKNRVQGSTIRQIARDEAMTESSDLSEHGQIGPFNHRRIERIKIVENGYPVAVVQQPFGHV